MATLRTVTLNSGFDDTFEASGLTWGGVERVLHFSSVPSGKGVNASRTARALGVPTRVYSLVGADDRDSFAAALDRERIEHRLVRVPGRTRHNLTLLTAEHIGAHMVAAGFRLDDPGPVAELLDMVAAECRPGDVVSCSGSVPPGAPTSVWADAAQRLRRAGATIVLDAQSDAMVEALRTGSVDIATPNEHEIDALPGARGVDSALRVMAGFGVRHPVVTLGERGAAFLQDGEAVRGYCAVSRPKQAVGAGDALLAGICAGLINGTADTAGLVAGGLAAAAWHVGGRVEAPVACLERVRIVTL